MPQHAQKFAIDFLTDYTDDALLQELRRIASQIPSGIALSKACYEQHSPKASYSTIQRRFGGWKQALDRAGLGHLYHGQPVSEKMRSQPIRGLSKEDLIDELKRVHALVATDWLTAEDFNLHSITSSQVVRKRFGTFREGLDAAGIVRPPWKPRKFTDQQCFENLAELWTHYGRSPNYSEMFHAPSTIQAKTYVERWGTWRKAKQAFVDWSNSEDTSIDLKADVLRDEAVRAASKPDIPKAKREEADCRDIRPGLRFKVFRRDSFRCVACGRSPATHLHIVLHADHILAVSNGGKTTFENLQTLCQDCNLGKGMS